MGMAVLPFVASAQSSPVLVQKPALTGQASDALEALTVQACEDGIKNSTRKVVSTRKVKKLERKHRDLKGCSNAGCLAKLSSLLQEKPKIFVKATIEEFGGSYKIQIEMSVLSAGKVQKVVVLGDTCQVCTTGQLASAIRRTVGNAVNALSGKMVDVTLSSVPSGATFKVGETGGSDPFRVMLPPGKHYVSATKQGFPTITKDITVNTGGAQEFDFRFSKDGGPQKSGGGGAMKWVVATGAVAAIGTGVYFLSIDGKGTCSADAMACPEVYETREAGWGLVGGGVALGGIATYLFLKGSNSNKSSQTSVAATPVRGGGFVALSRTW